MKNLEAIRLIRTKLQAFKVLQCKLMHEDVVDVRLATATDVYSTNNYFFERKGFCIKSVRDLNISCAHSMAFIKYAQLIEELGRLGKIEKITVRLAEIKELVTAVYLLDHEKGELEKQLALSLINKLTKTEMLKTNLARINQSHQQLTGQINILHAEILIAIDVLTC